MLCMLLNLDSLYVYVIGIKSILCTFGLEDYIGDTMLILD